MGTEKEKIVATDYKIKRLENVFNLVNGLMMLILIRNNCKFISLLIFAQFSYMWKKNCKLSKLAKNGFTLKNILYPLQSYRKWTKLLQIKNKDNVTNNFLEIYKKKLAN